MILFSCAQVGQISGGSKDEFAPHPVEGKTTPPNESTNFTSTGFEMVFDEFIQLNNPLQTIVMIPDHANPKASIHKKTLRIEWDEKLQENTTYVVYLNGTVKDVSEGNDSLITYVFSTGISFDSLKYSVRVIDALTNRPAENTTVGLFEHPDSLKPYYFSNTDRTGLAQFDYLKSGNYFLRAFKDENKDLRIQPAEAIAFKSNAILLDSSIVDTVPLILSKPTLEKKLRTFKYEPPGSFLVTANYSLTNADFYLNGEQLDSNNIRFYSKDSLQFFANVDGINSFEFIAQTSEITDTVSLRITEKEKNTKVVLLPVFKNNQIGPHETLAFQVKDLIKSINPEKILITNPLDSNRIIPFTASYEINQVVLDLKRTDLKQLNIVFQAGAVNSLNGAQNDSLKVDVQLKAEKDYGNLIVNIAEFEFPVIVDLMQNGKIIKSTAINESGKLTLQNLDPGEYQFRVITDSNKNGQWDPGALSKDLQPEKVHLFSELVKVRANWDVEVELIPNN